MISKITGELTVVTTDKAFIAAGPFEYEVQISEYSRKQLQQLVHKTVSLHTIDYIDGNTMGGRLVPRLIGFLTESEKEFYELLCSVDGVGSKKALRALIRPVGEIAASIEQQDVKLLSTLPGIGAAMAERIVAKLRRKVSMFVLSSQLTSSSTMNPTSIDYVTEAFQALLGLGHSEVEARKMLDTALEENKEGFTDANELICAVYNPNKKLTGTGKKKKK